MTVLVAPNLQATTRFQVTLGREIATVKNARELQDYLSKNPAELLVVIAPEIELDEALQIAKLDRIDKAVSVILVRQRLEVSVLTKAMQAGVREVIAADDAEELLAAVKRSRLATAAAFKESNAPEVHAIGKTALIFAAKGGVGKTTLAINLAEALALEGDKSVCLIDLDLQFGDIAVALQLEPTKNLSAAIRMKGNLDDEGIRSLLVQYRPNLHVLLAPMEPADVEFISADLVEKVIRSLRKQFDYVVIDSPPAITDFILKAFDQADEYLLMTTMEVPSVKNLKVTLETLQAIGMPQSKVNVIVNRSTAKVGMSIADVQKTVGIPIRAAIPESNIIPNLLNQGKTAVGENQRHAVSRAFISVAKFLQGEAEHPQEHRGLFSRRAK
jgi:pilus assembly protein CpaE